MADDGLQVVWEEVAGAARAKWLLWRGENIDATTAKEWGVVAEILPQESVRARAIKIATNLAAKPSLYLRLQKQNSTSVYCVASLKACPTEWPLKD
jgi:enoyl-CoA hydratase/carnithine racemase